MKQRLLVMNGSKIVQANKAGKWQNSKVEKAGTLKPGIYSIYNAKEADTTQEYSGVVIYADRKNVYQQIGKGFVSHDASKFLRSPEVGVPTTISYSVDEAVVTEAKILSRGKKI